MPVEYHHRELPPYETPHPRIRIWSVALSPLFAAATMLGALLIAEPDAAKGIIKTILFQELKSGTIPKP